MLTCETRLYIETRFKTTNGTRHLGNRGLNFSSEVKKGCTRVSSVDSRPLKPPNCISDNHSKTILGKDL